MSHTSAQVVVVVVTTSKRVFSASHRDLHPLRVSPARFVSSFVHEGGEGAVYVFLLSGISFKRTPVEAVVEEDLNQRSSEGGRREVAVRDREGPGKIVVGGRSFPDNASDVGQTRKWNYDRSVGVRGLHCPRLSLRTGTGEQAYGVVGEINLFMYLLTLVVSTMYCAPVRRRHSWE